LGRGCSGCIYGIREGAVNHARNRTGGRISCETVQGRVPIAIEAAWHYIARTIEDGAGATGAMESTHMISRTLFIKLSAHRGLRRFSERSRLGRRMSNRFVAGISVDEALEAAAKVNTQGSSVTIDNLGENVTTADEARSCVAVYHRLLDSIEERGLDANVSLKLTQMGLDLDENLAREGVGELVEHAGRIGSFVRVDMEGSLYTQRTIDLVRDVHRRPGSAGRVGAVIQSYLRRSERDVEELVSEGIRVRLCKGAYKEASSIAWQAKSEVDDSFVRLMKTLLSSGVYHGIATHDPRMIEATIKHAGDERIDREAFEFQMLYGIRRDLQEQLRKEGWRLRVYVPFGEAWYPYFMRRLAERPANVLFLAKNVLRA
jgi:proline dehydrogenase